MPRPPIESTEIVPRPRDQRFAIRPAPTTSPLTKTSEVSDTKQAATWQVDSYNYVDTIGEIGYALNLKAAVIAQCLLQPQVKQYDPATGKYIWVDCDDPRVRRVVESFRPPQGEQGELLRYAAMHLESAGESYLYGEPVLNEMGQPAGLTWEFLSVLELEVGRDGTVKRNRRGKQGGGAGNKDNAAPPNAYVARMWNRDLKYSDNADSPMRRVMPICKEVVLYTQVLEAIAKSRLSAGLLYIPWDMSFGPDDEWDDPGDQGESVDEFEVELRKHLNAPIDDRSSESSLIPLLMRGPAILRQGDGTSYPAKDLMGLIELSRELDGLYKELRAEALTRLASGLDLPPEIISGKASLSGLGGGNVAEQIDEDFIARHIIPAGQKITSFITTAYLRPMLAVFEGIPADQTEWFRVVLDTSPITTDSDLSAPATMGVQLETISDEAWREASGFTEDDAPSDEEQYRRTLEKLLLVQPTLGPAILPELYPEQNMTAMLRKWEIGQSAPGGGLGQTPMLGQPPGRPLLADTPMVPMILAAADRDLQRALEKAGNRLISHLNGRDKDAAASLRRVQSTERITHAGMATVDLAGLTIEDLFVDCFDDLRDRVIEWLTVDLTRRGASPFEARRRCEVAAEELVTQLTAHASTALERKVAVCPNGTMIPDALVASSLAAGDLVARS